MKVNNLPILDSTMRKVWRGTYWGNDALYFEQEDGVHFVLTHIQDCCEDVEIESIDGDLDDLIGEPLLMAEEIIKVGGEPTLESNTWTFYKFATVKGYVTVRFLGWSNGYYSERVDWFYLSEDEVEKMGYQMKKKINYTRAYCETCNDYHYKYWLDGSKEVIDEEDVDELLSTGMYYVECKAD